MSRKRLDATYTQTVRAFKALAGAFVAFLVAFGVILAISIPSWHRSDCSGEECLGNYVISVSFAFLGGFAAGAGAGAVIWAVLARRAAASATTSL
jgi:hypothetical protein